ncbi:MULTISPECIES: 30S ribosomal protein S8 [Halobacterium]|uniref:Small ribosomal subunit protein uS8 n=5 Tax=Halobacterium salinarum TaxID=2242 RepID=RS8_HALSA|nr:MULTISPECIES: 30S ribosomal protein S8 [Halobacterium]B0R671.1 RecName: Full=Small ribosomal subunit protein uS8; AltName: Full=30S ribosomal protein S8 [Halobacterium salinarum R1]Q9HPB9.2 RecName: Full=Small ribosomal subunit protein uS8; AltName: Full=30S ribosomal protein S8 [Halobacterium salinarum NRC-1]MBB6088957.1 small subunit ribosomal protein S8 [Halobacterium salinarum]MCF2164826.1 30S ribosomal protein S8 [Halobacterium salinarum]MCF2168549.1 30S ribosomal protein S8 [Halobacte
MTANDPLSDALSGIDNAESVGHLTHTVAPASNMVGSVLEVFYDRGYIDGFEFVDNGKAGRFEVELKGAINECGPVNPRYSVGADGFEQWEKRYLPARDYGSLVVTTSHGIMSHYEAREAGIGGQVIAYVY